MHMVLEIRIRSAEKEEGFFACLGQIYEAPTAWASKTWLLVPAKAGCCVHKGACTAVGKHCQFTQLPVAEAFLQSVNAKL